MIKLKQCPRCQGDLHTAMDLDGFHTACLQCGYRGYPDFTPEVLPDPKRRKRRVKTIQEALKSQCWQAQ